MNDIEKIKQKIDIVDLLSSIISIKKAGRNFKANCPFHNEKTPSFMISPERQMWHCFGCGKGGDIFTFIMEYEGIPFAESVRYLAEKAGVPLTTSYARSETEHTRNSIYTINTYAAQFFSYILFEHKAGKEALAYVTEKRGIPAELAKKYQLGYAPSGNNLTTYVLKKKNCSPEEIIASGLAYKKNGRLTDFFFDRLIFPLFDMRGNIIAFSGRGLTEKLQPKYINNRETPVYRKGETLYGLYQAKEAIRKEGSIIVVEGEFDVLSSVKEGIGNVAAVKGTALTEFQIKLIKRYADKLIFCFDQDQAGRDAMRRSVALLEKEGLVASVISLPRGKDLDELAKTDPILFKKTIKHPIPMYDFIIDSSVAEHNPNTVDGKRAILAQTLTYLSAIENEVIKEHYIRKLSQALDSSADALRRQMQKSTQREYIKTPSPKEEHKKDDPLSLREQYLLSLILQSDTPQEALRTAAKIIDSIEFIYWPHHLLFKTLKESMNTMSITDISKTLPAELLPLFDLCLLKEIPHIDDKNDFEKELIRVARQVRIDSIKYTLKNLTVQISEKEKADGPEEDIVALQQRFQAFSRLLSESL